MKWLDKLLGRTNTAPAAEVPQMREKISAPQQIVFTEPPPLPWDAPTWEKIRSSDYARWYLTQVGAIERYAKTYRVTFILTQRHRIKTVELPGSCGYYEALIRLETARLTRKDHVYRIQDWPHTQADEQYQLFDGPCRLIGYVHSHPQALSVALSEGDVALHRELLRRGIADISVILNPHRRDILSYGGEECGCCDTILMMPESEISNWSAGSDGKIQQ